jgi:hypothetical protein
MPDPAIATAADYADAMISARRAVRIVSLLLLLTLLGQLALFFLIRFDVLKLPTAAEATTMPVSDQNLTYLWEYLGYASLFLGVALSVVLGFVLLLLLNIMLVGRLIGVGRVTSAYIWCLVLVVLLFPWQALLSKWYLIPGALYTWSELSDPLLGAKFPTPDLTTTLVHWARYVFWPVVAIIILLRILVKSSRGMKQALGEDDAMLPPEVNV